MKANLKNLPALVGAQSVPWRSKAANSWTINRARRLGRFYVPRKSIVQAVESLIFEAWIEPMTRADFIDRLEHIAMTCETPSYRVGSPVEKRNQVPFGPRWRRMSERQLKKILKTNSSFIKPYKIIKPFTLTNPKN